TGWTWHSAAPAGPVRRPPSARSTMAAWPPSICCAQASARSRAADMRNLALDAWGDYDRDDPYPLFAQVQADGPVHEVTLADGHPAWLIARHDQASAAPNPAGLSKDMHAAPARDGGVVAEGLPGPAFARHMLSVDPPHHTRLRRLTSAAFSRPRMAALRP